MRNSIRLKLEMAARIRDNLLARPSDNPGQIAALERLTERIGRAEALDQQAVSGRTAVSAAIAVRRQLRQDIAEILALLAALIHKASSEAPDLGAGITRPSRSVSNQAFLTRARVAATTAAAHRELLQRYGMSGTYPEDLGRMLDEFEAALNTKHAGQAAHVGAHADLEAVTAEIMQLVRQLDALTEFRFRNDAEALAAWRSARNIPWRGVERQQRPPAGGDVRPAA